MKRSSYILWAVLMVLFCCAMDVYIYRYRLGFENHGIQLPYIYKLQDPSLYPGDRFMDTMGGYFSYFWLFMAWVTERASLETAFAIGHGLVLAARYAGIFVLTRAAFPRHLLTPFLATWFSLWGETVVGAESFHWYYFTHTPVATVMGIWALVLAMKGKWWPAFALAGFMFNVHAMQSAYVLLMLGAGLLCDRANYTARLLTAPVAWIVAAIPGLYWMFGTGAVGSPEGLGRLIRAFYPYHFFPSSFNVWNWLGIAFMVLLGGVAIWALRVEKQAYKLGAMGVAILAMWLVGGVLLETMEPGILIKMHLYRASSYLLIVSLVLAAAYVTERIFSRICRSWQTVVAVAAMLLAAVLGSFNFLRYAETHIQVLLGAIVLAAVVSAMPLPKGVRLAAAWAAVGVLATLPVLQTRVRFQNMQGYFWWLGKYVEIQEWALKNSQPADRFLVPPDMNAFRAGSQRPIVFEWFDGAAMMWDREYAEYWEKWYLESGGKFRKEYSDPSYVRLARGWINKPQGEIEEIARREGAVYIVMRPPHPWEKAEGIAKEWVGEKLFANEAFFVVRTPPAPTSASLEQ